MCYFLFLFMLLFIDKNLIDTFWRGERGKDILTNIMYFNVYKQYITIVEFSTTFKFHLKLVILKKVVSLLLYDNEFHLKIMKTS